MAENTVRAALAIGGLALLTWGARLAWPPAGFIVPGAFFIFVALWTKR